MRKRITNAQAVDLANSGKATYEDGSKPKALVTVEDSFNEAKSAIQSLSKQVNKDVSTGNEAILSACDVIIESMNLYHEAVVATLNNLPVPESFDMGAIDKINDRLITILQELVAEKPKKVWQFDVEKDWQGKTVTVTATEVTHK